MLPPKINAQVWYPPDEIAMALDKPETVTGTDELFVVPSPSWPKSLYPQHWTVPAEIKAQV